MCLKGVDPREVTSRVDDRVVTTWGRVLEFGSKTLWPRLYSRGQASNLFSGKAGYL